MALLLPWDGRPSHRDGAAIDPVRTVAQARAE
jgi:hypothetical protein